MTSSVRHVAAFVLASSIAGSSVLALQQVARSVSDGVYTAQQAARGQEVYTAKCASCHAPTLAGRSGPPLVGDSFLARWETRPLVELANKIHRTMPRLDERMTPQQAADVLAYILQAGKFPAGSADLVLDEAALKLVNFPAPATPRPAVVAAQMPTLPPAGNMAQVMRGLLFPTANIIFTVQTIDPAVRKPPPMDSDAAGGFDWFAWGGNVYTGWDVIDYAAVSLAESAQLMLTPGRTCENGRPVPVTDPDWIRFTDELAEAGKASYKASQTRNQETVSAVTEQLNNSCSNCHRVFRGRTRCVKP